MIYLKGRSSTKCPCRSCSTSGVFNLLNSRANLHLSHHSADHSHCRLQNYHGYIKHHHRGMGSSPGDVSEVPLHCFTYITAHSTALPSLHLYHRHFTYVTLILQPFCCFTYITAHSTTLPLLHLHHRHFTYVTAHSTILPLLHPHHRHFTYVTAHSPTLLPLHLSQLILQPFRCFTYVTGHSTTLPLLHLCHRHFTYFTWQALMHRGMKKQSVVD